MKARAKLAVGAVVLVSSACSGLDRVGAEREAAGGATGGGAGLAGTGGMPASPCVAVDGDGDGVTTLSASCTLILIPGAPLTGDCDDADPALATGAYIDADGDGVGNPESTACLPPGALPSGYALDGMDCDDTNVEVNPSAVEVAGDGIDQNCDGSDGFVACDGTFPVCPCVDRLTELAPVEAPCDGVDLAVARFSWCSNGGCGQSSLYYVQVANLGTEDARGDISVGIDGFLAAFLRDLPAGQVTPPIPWQGLTPMTASVSAVDAVDCNPSNDLLTLPTSGISAVCK